LGWLASSLLPQAEYRINLGIGNLDMKHKGQSVGYK
jgi:hypothetical protein